jgi:hypothetical protein
MTEERQVMNSEEIELFLDTHRISTTYNVQRRLCQPVKHEENPIVISEHPWEHLYVHVFGNVMPKEDGRGYRMWYIGGAKGMQKGQYLCYAESEDAIHWQKIMSNRNPYEDCAETNILLGLEANIHGPCVMRNCHDDDPSRRYLMLFDSYSWFRPEIEDQLDGIARWCYVATSPNGLDWTPAKGIPVIPGKADCGQSVVWDPANKKYIAYLRGTRNNSNDPYASLYGETTRVRYVRAATSPDFLHWSKPFELLRADERDGDPNHQIHQFAVTRRGGQYVGLLSMMHITDYFDVDYEDKGKLLMEESCCDTQLAVSRDGFNWQRCADRAVFLPLGAPGQWDAVWLVTACRIFYDGDRMLIYYQGWGTKRSDYKKNMALGVAILPRDRFQAISPKLLSQPAVLETKPLFLADGDLRINANAAHGKIVAELVDFEGNVLEGFGQQESDAVVTDGLDHVIRWKGRRLTDAIDRESVTRYAVRVRFYIHNASLFAAAFPFKTQCEK